MYFLGHGTIGVIWELGNLGVGISHLFRRIRSFPGAFLGECGLPVRRSFFFLFFFFFLLLLYGLGYIPSTLHSTGGKRCLVYLSVWGCNLYEYLQASDWDISAVSLSISSSAGARMGGTPSVPSV